MSGSITTTLEPAANLLAYLPRTPFENSYSGRISSFFWIQSMIRGDAERTILFDMDQAIQRLNRDSPDHPSAVQLTGVYHNLLRRWAEV